MSQVSDICLDSISENSSIGYILEFDLEYPNEMHKLHNDSPLALKKLEITQNMLSKYMLSKYVIRIGELNKLVPNLGNKSK